MKILKFIDKEFEEIVLIGIFSIMVVLVFLQVVMRYVFQSSLSWSEELARYMFLWIIWLGASYATKKNAHISLDFVTSRLSLKLQKTVWIIKMAIWIAFTIFLAYISFRLTYMIFERGQMSPALKIPMGYAYASIPVGVTMMLFRIIQNFITEIKERRKNHE
ncbi:TRAP transporter small permease subunit [Alkalibaculum sp. M08DMB]|uniref:TRAP transporter small permease subunit n=1 Tax=Alkalibaculum sporogenes TaxID=2655001 RepID=A0A6A7K7V7_9FIRM|nr:TRAP transporter small permease [Alkalibaculum sporogenes]MPW25569.1 TRAP transporter small permease subunit [Alkalibaculum sporogenes]